MSDSPTVRALNEIEEHLDNEEYDELYAKLPLILLEHREGTVSKTIDRLLDHAEEDGDQR